MRLAEVIWIPEYLGDIESDLSAFHRIEDPSQMTSARFFMLAERLYAYQGALRTRMEYEEHIRQEEEENFEKAEAMAKKFTPAPSQPTSQPGQNGFMEALMSPEAQAKALEMSTL